MNFNFLRWGIMLSGHVYDRRQLHDCNVLDCPARINPAEIKYVIANRIAGSYSERFDSKEDVERALRYFAPFGSAEYLGLGKRYEILESVQIHGQWMIGDPTLPSDQLFFVSKGRDYIELDPDV